MYCLDTSAVLELMYGTLRGKKILETVDTASIIISSFTVYELLNGLKEQERESVEQFLKDVHTISFDVNAAKKSSSVRRELKTKGSLINELDILIAGVCLAHNLTLITKDNDFKKIISLNSIIL